MNEKPNYVKPTPQNGVYYLWVHDASMAMLCIFGPRSKHTKGLFLHARKPKERDKSGKLYRFHRVRIEVVRTEREVAARERKLKRAKERNWKRLQKMMTEKKVRP